MNIQQIIAQHPKAVALSFYQFGYPGQINPETLNSMIVFYGEEFLESLENNINSAGYAAMAPDILVPANIDPDTMNIKNQLLYQQMLANQVDNSYENGIPLSHIIKDPATYAPGTLQVMEAPVNADPINPDTGSISVKADPLPPAPPVLPALTGNGGMLTGGGGSIEDSYPYPQLQPEIFAPVKEEEKEKTFWEKNQMIIIVVIVLIAIVLLSRRSTPVIIK